MLCWIKLCRYGMFWLLIIIIQLVNVQSSWIIRRIISGCLVLLELTQCRAQFIFKQKLVVHILKRLELIYLLPDLTILLRDNEREHFHSNRPYFFNISWDIYFFFLLMVSMKIHSLLDQFFRIKKIVSYLLLLKFLLILTRKLQV